MQMLVRINNISGFYPCKSIKHNLDQHISSVFLLSAKSNWNVVCPVWDTLSWFAPGTCVPPVSALCPVEMQRSWPPPGCPAPCQT